MTKAAHPGKLNWEKIFPLQILRIGGGVGNEHISAQSFVKRLQSGHANTIKHTSVSQCQTQEAHDLVLTGILKKEVER